VSDKTFVMSSEMDAQVSIYHISWEGDYGFCCHIDEECAKELVGEQLGQWYSLHKSSVYLFPVFVSSLDTIID
jgi:hypothetical protein